MGKSCDGGSFDELSPLGQVRSSIGVEMCLGNGCRSKLNLKKHRRSMLHFHENTHKHSQTDMCKTVHL